MRVYVTFHVLHITVTLRICTSIRMKAQIVLNIVVQGNAADIHKPTMRMIGIILARSCAVFYTVCLHPDKCYDLIRRVSYADSFRAGDSCRYHQACDEEDCCCDR